jgi:hypothetical protein
MCGLDSVHNRAIPHYTSCMLKMHLILRRPSESQFELALPISFRIIFACIAGILVASMLSLGATPLIPMIITIVTILAALYEERWIFNAESHTVVHNSGLIKLCTRRTIAFGEIESFVLVNYREIPNETVLSARRGVALRSLVSLQIITSNGGSRTVEIRSNRHGGTLKQSAEIIADFCNKPLEFRE